MIEGGVAGGSALQQASQRRATADRLIVEARYLEALANDERAMATLLANLPPAYAIMHDLRLPGSKGNIDHLVIGPGGAFVVVTRRCVEAVSYRGGSLWAGESPLHDLLEAVRVESQLLTQSLQTPVVPVVGLLGVVLPSGVPNALDGVLVCSGDNVVRVITRGSHTLLPPHKVGEAAERALSLLHNPGSVARSESASGVPAEPAADRSVQPVVPPHAPVSAESLQRRLATARAAKQRAKAGESKSELNPTMITRAPARRPPRVDATGGREDKSRSGRSRSLGFVATVIAGLCLIAVVLGTVGAMLWRGDARSGTDKAAETTVTVFGGTSSTPPVSTLAGPLAASVPAPKVEFLSTCPAPGAGWQLTPVWPGDLAGLTQYEIDLQNLDGSWGPLPPLATAQATWDSLQGQPAGVGYAIRITALMSDGSRSANTPTVVTTPATSC